MAFVIVSMDINEASYNWRAGWNVNSKSYYRFQFQGKEYNYCTTDGRNDGYEWCSPEPEYEMNNKYGFCPREWVYFI